MGKYIEWLSRELGEEITTQRAIYITLCVISFLIATIGGCAENILIACIGIAGIYFFGVKSKMIVWQKKKK